jgi:hypothetical protein
MLKVQTKVTGARRVQSRKVSFIEAVLNTALGFVVSLCLWFFVVIPFLDMPMRAGQGLAVVSLFTAASIARGYLVRRFFETRFQALARRLARRLTSGSNC